MALIVSMRDTAWWGQFIARPLHTFLLATGWSKAEKSWCCRWKIAWCWTCTAVLARLCSTTIEYLGWQGGYGTIPRADEWLAQRCCQQTLATGILAPVLRHCSNFQLNCGQQISSHWGGGWACICPKEKTVIYPSYLLDQSISRELSGSRNEEWEDTPWRVSNFPAAMKSMHAIARCNFPGCNSCIAQGT